MSYSMKMADIVEEKPENHLKRPSGPSHSTAFGDDVTATRQSAETESAIANDGLGSDLPDIVDVVMAMGRTDDQTSDRTPSPPQPITPPNRVPAHLEQLADHARKYVEAASSANTRRAYAADWKHFCA
jgi:hypothetical protein